MYSLILTQLISILFFSSPNPSAFATSFIEQPFPDSVAEAPVIVRGTIGVNYTNWADSPSLGRRIYTFYELQTEEVLKGKVASSQTIILRELGGIKDDIGMEVAGTAQFNKDEDVVVFLGSINTDGSHDVYGMAMGKYNIVKNEEGKEYLEGAGVSSIPSPTNQYNHQAILKKEKPTQWTLETLRKLIKTQENVKNFSQHPPDTKLPVVKPSLTPIPFEKTLPVPPSTTSSIKQSLLSTSLYYGLGVFGLLLLVWFMRSLRANLERKRKNEKQ
jgi:hypothetical protein